mgnify:CR=1 FL=1
MTLYLDGNIVDPDYDLLRDSVTGQFDAAEAAWDQQAFDNPVMAARRISELADAEQGEVIRPAMTARGYTSPAVRAEPESPMLPAEVARARVKEEGLDLSIDDGGIREGVLDILVERKRAEAQRKFLLDNAPASTIPVQLLAGFAASAIDPINIASAFIPVVGEARYASMLANATTRAARFGVRARVGALEGAVGAAMVEPLVLYASAQDQADYDITNSLLNVAFGSVLGGGLHAAGGLVSDLRRGNLLEQVRVESLAEAPQGAEARATTPEIALRRGDDDPMLRLSDSLARGIEADRARIAEASAIQARDDLIPQIRAELQAVAEGRLPNVADLKGERSAINRSLSTLDESFRDRAKAFQQQGLTRKQAERAARDAITEERQRLTERSLEVDDALAGNRSAEQARAELSRLERGEIPERYQARIDEAAGKAASGFELRQTARAMAESAPWQVRESALRAAVAQAVTGRPVDVEPIFHLADPAKRQAALERIKEPIRTVSDPEGEVAAYMADETANSLDGTDLEGAERMLADEQALTDEMAAQAGIDLKPFLREAEELAADAETYAAAYRAAALCQLRN